VGPVNNFEEAFQDPQMLARSMIVEGEVPGVGPWKHVGNPIKIGRKADGVLRLPPPHLGEHTEQVLMEAGFDQAAIDELRAAGAI
jgi:crotonobetainyl-CoA:carnitine CoA-transferase CaiB-like acyl-CoA transferase